MYIQHVYTYPGGIKTPVATIVGLDPKRIGVAVCHPTDRFKKKDGVALALQRAESGELCSFVDKNVVFQVRDNGDPDTLEGCVMSLDHLLTFYIGQVYCQLRIQEIEKESK